MPYAVARLAHYQQVQQVEFALLYNSTGQLLVSPDKPQSEVRGAYWDPARLVADTLANGVGYTRTGM